MGIRNRLKPTNRLLLLFGLDGCHLVVILSNNWVTVIITPDRHALNQDREGNRCSGEERFIV